MALGTRGRALGSVTIEHLVFGQFYADGISDTMPRALPGIVSDAEQQAKCQLAPGVEKQQSALAKSLWDTDIPHIPVPSLSATAHFHIAATARTVVHSPMMGRHIPCQQTAGLARAAGR